MKKLLIVILFLPRLVASAQPYMNDMRMDFTIDSSRKPIFCFHYKPIPENSYRWGFYHKNDISKGKLPFMASRISAAGRNSDTMVCEDFSDSLGIYWICLETTFTNGLKDTICKKINNNFHTDGPGPGPNIFTPNSVDSLNSESFNIRIENESFYELMIFDRWGAKVFESKDKNVDWNGRKFNSGIQCPDGTYYYILKYRYKGKGYDAPVLNGVIRLMR